MRIRKVLVSLFMGMITATVVMFAVRASADDRLATRILTCLMSAGPYGGKLEVTENGAAFLVLDRAPGGDKGTCQLAIRSFNYMPNAQVPHLTMMFDRMSCEPTVGKKADAALLTDITMLVRGDSGKREGRVQWLRRKQVMPCELQAYDKDELKRDAEAYAEGKWGK
jgi:hypothetical protein